MNAYDASEQAYKRGYEQGKKDARKKGRWEKRTAIVFDCEITACRCPECNTTWDAETNFCPNCGADMRQTEEGDV